MVCSNMANGTDARSTTEAPVGGFCVGDTFFPDDSFRTDCLLEPAEAHLLAQECAPDAVLGLSARVKACDIDARTIERNSVFGAAWTNNLAVVIGTNAAKGEVTILVRSKREFAKKTKRFPAPHAALEVHDLMYG